MPKGVKQKMNIDRFEQIFGRYSFEEKKEVLIRLRSMFKSQGNIIKEELRIKIDSIDSQISEIDNHFS